MIGTNTVQPCFFLFFFLPVLNLMTYTGMCNFTFILVAELFVASWMVRSSDLPNHLINTIEVRNQLAKK